MNQLKNTKPTPNSLLFDDERMFEFIFKAYYLRLRAFARKFIRDQEVAEDMVQDVFLKVWQKRKTIQEDTFESYLFTLMRNACLNHVKHQKIVNSYQLDLKQSQAEEGLYYADFFSDPFHQTIFNEIQQEIDLAMQKLPEQTRKVFHLSRFKGLKNTEIASLLDISVRTVEKHNTKALHRIKAHLSAHYLYVVAVLDLLKEISN